MADVFYGTNRGVRDADPKVVTYGTSTQSTDIELRIDTGKGLLRKEVELAVLNILARIRDGDNTTYPPL